MIAVDTGQPRELLLWYLEDDPAVPLPRPRDGIRGGHKPAPSAHGEVGAHKAGHEDPGDDLEVGARGEVDHGVPGILRLSVLDIETLIAKARDRLFEVISLVDDVSDLSHGPSPPLVEVTKDGAIVVLEQAGCV